MFQEHGAGVSISPELPTRKTPVVISLQFQQNNHTKHALSNFTGHNLQEQAALFITLYEMVPWSVSLTALLLTRVYVVREELYRQPDTMLGVMYNRLACSLGEKNNTLQYFMFKKRRPSGNPAFRWPLNCLNGCQPSQPSHGSPGIHPSTTQQKTEYNWNI